MCGLHSYFYVRLLLLSLCASAVWSLTCSHRKKYYYTTSCWGVGRCRESRRKVEYYCCAGWTGSGCSQAICNGKTNPTACKDSGWVQESASGPTHTNGGGKCTAPGVCDNCNNGFYPNGAHCSPCSEIANCYYPKCTTAHNSLCHYCEGVVRNDPNQYGWWAYTRWRDGGRSCQRACSWRTGSRCYPGNCPETTTASCRCHSGFSGVDCKTMTEYPEILYNFIRLNQTTSTSVEMVEGPGDPSAGPPQPTTWTNNLQLQTAEAHVHAQYVEQLPAAPSFINTANSLIGITTGGVSLKLRRGGSLIGNSLETDCTSPKPMANNYVCEGRFTLSDSWTGFQHLDRLVFTAYATNGGYIAVIDRERGNSEGTYQMIGKTRTNTFEIGFDTENPSHCKIMSGCQTNPLTIDDTTADSSFPITWDGWNDAVAGLKSYHFEVFHLRSSGVGTEAELVHGDKLTDAVTDTVPASTTQITVNVSIPGPYSVVITAADKAGNLKSARAITIFDDIPVVELQGTREHVADTDGSCTWSSTPAGPVVRNADPTAGCDWLTNAPPTVIVRWKDNFINKRHHLGQWLNPVASLTHVDDVLDDHRGVRQTKKTDNILGVVRFEVSYNVSYEGAITHHAFAELVDPLAEDTIITETMVDGSGLNITVRGYDIMGAYEDDTVVIKADSSPPVVENLWLTRGDRLDLSVHNLEELAKLTFEWNTYDYHSGIHEVQWKLYDNYTQQTIQHGTAYESPQGNTETLDHCEEAYGNHPRGARCYCTPFDGCFHQHFQVKPDVVESGDTGIAQGKHTADHDGDYYIEVTVTNRARLQTIRTLKITIDTSPPVPGTVHEGVAGAPDIDFQVDKQVHVHWKDFFDKESGVVFYRYGHGTACIDADAFAVGTESGLTETYLDYASFNVTTEGTYYVTVAAYNRALDHSVPVCSDGITIDSSIHTVTEVVVKGARTQAGLLRSSDDTVWYIHPDRTVQKVQNPPESCRSAAHRVPDDQFVTYPKTTDSLGRLTDISNTVCTSHKTANTDLMSVMSSTSNMEITWDVATDGRRIYDYSVGLASTVSEEPDLFAFTSTNNHQHILLQHPNLDDGQIFHIVIKTTSKAGKPNIQTIGPFLVDKSAPTFQGEIQMSFPDETYSYTKVLIQWDVDAFVDAKDDSLKLDLAIGTSANGVDVYPFTAVRVGRDCDITPGLVCTGVLVDELHDSLQDQLVYYATLRATNTGGVSTMASSGPTIFDVNIPSRGHVVDLDDDPTADRLDDVDFQSSVTTMTSRWYGFRHPGSTVLFTACVATENQIIEETCTDVGDVNTVTINDLQLDYFKTYRTVVTARTKAGNVTVFSDGIVPIDTSKVLEIQVYDGVPCTRAAESNQQLNFNHHTQDIIRQCEQDISHQVSLTSLGVHWNIPSEYKPYTSDVRWRVEKRAPIVDLWTSITEPVYTSSAAGSVSTNLVLQSGRYYRFVLQFCAGTLCFPDLPSDGVAVIHNPPLHGAIVVEYSNSSAEIRVLMEVFKDGDLQDDKEAKASIGHYEWALTESSHDGRIITNWSRVVDYQNVDSDQIKFIVSMSKRIGFTKCWRISIRGYSRAGLYSTVSSDIRKCDDVTQVRRALVLDAVKTTNSTQGGATVGEPITFDGDGDGTAWTEPDKDYTPFTNILSAIWPSLRYPAFNWAILELHTNDLIIYHDEETSLSLNQPCDLPDVIACGRTSDVYINAEFDAGVLIHGKRYVVCVHANATTLKHEYWDEDLPAISVCSDGVTVDTSPPTAGDVWVLEKGAVYQSSLSELTVYWETFVDVEELRNRAHTSGITHYEVAIGTHHGAVDVLPYTNVGVVNHFTAHGLKLQNGHEYYASVAGTDFIGRTTVSVSTAIVPDITPPTLSDIRISLGSGYITDLSTFRACWSGLFSDAESGILYYKWSLGSHVGHDDMHAYTKTEQDCAKPDASKLSALQEGRTYYVSVMGFNGVGLSTLATSWAYLVDMTPPVTGQVFDGNRSTSAVDLSYTRERHTLDAYWNGFHDDHSNIREYRVSVGTKQWSSNIVQSVAVGTNEEVHLRHLQLSEGATYYVTVTSCNMAGLYSSDTSDGVTVDTSPPVPGRVNDGAETADIEYQHSRNYIAAKWHGFVDPQSGISHFTWRVGTSRGADDVVTTQEVHGGTVGIVIDMQATYGKQLPVQTRLYSTVRAYNKAGRWSEATSSGMIVDPTDPVTVSPVSHVPLGSAVPSTSVLRSTLKLAWAIEDQESYIERQYLSIVSHEGEDFNVSLQIPGFVRDYTFTELQFHDGSLYDVYHVACNGARACVKSIIENILVDSTPPTAGTFAINTNHAADLERQPGSWMVWNSSSLSLAWLGFGDEHSGVVKYTVNVGSEYMADDLNGVPDTSLTVLHDMDTVHLSDEGKVQVFTIPTQLLTGYQHIFVTLWAENGVGLRSDIVHSQFKLIPGGSLELIRRCSAYSCQGHCVCAAQDRKCPLTGSSAPCVNVTGDAAFAEVIVTDDLYLSDAAGRQIITHTPVRSLLAASWHTHEDNVKLPNWYEWSIGLTQYSTPTGIYGIHDRAWHDAARASNVYVTLDKEHMLTEGKRYSVFIRAWYDGTSFADYKSPGVIVRSSPPGTSNLFGRAVKEVAADGSSDIDYISATWAVAIDWTGKFKDGVDKTLTCNVYLSSTPGGHDTHVFDETMPGNITRVVVPSDVILKLVPGVRYYSNVQAVNDAGLHTIVTSDAFVLDNAPSVPGVVMDGIGIDDLEYQSSNTVVGAKWHGFTDLQSGVTSFLWCVSTATNPRSCDILPVTNVGLNTSVTNVLETPLLNGQMIISEVTAKDGIDQQSAVVESNGVIIDSTPPVKLRLDNLGANTVRNPSFENTNSSDIDMNMFKAGKNCAESTTIPDWDVNGCVAVLTGSASELKDGLAFVWVRGSISQTITGLEPGHVYRVSMYVSHLPSIGNTVSHANGHILFAGHQQSISLHTKHGHLASQHKLSWQLFTSYLTPNEKSSILEIISEEESFGFSVDNVMIQEVHAIDDVDTPNVQVLVDTAGDSSMVQALWLFEDAESGIKDYMWAIGTVRGGTQLQDFKQVGTHMFATSPYMYLPHGIHVFVTVVATNGAGLQTIGYSEGYTVDFTSPVFIEVFDGPMSGIDEDFQSSLLLSVNFAVDDPESEISTCSWAIGKHSNDVSVRTLEVIPNGQRSASYQLSPTDDLSHPYYSIVRCVNNVGLSSTASSDGVHVILNKPDVTNVHLDVIGTSYSQYPVLEGYHVRSDQLRIRWAGFHKADSVDRYQIQLKSDSYFHAVDVQDSTTGYVYTTIDDVNLTDGHYEIELIGINKLNVASQSVSTNVTILSKSPGLNGAHPLDISYDDVTEIVTVDWTDVFKAEFPLYYEVSVGSLVGSADIAQWQETRSTHFQFKVAAVGQYGKEISVTVRAVSPSGTFVTVATSRLIV